MILFRGNGAAARRYVKADRSRADEYYLGADDAVAEYTALDASGAVTATRALSADDAGWVDWINPETGESMGTPRAATEGTKGSPLFAEMTINAPKSCRSRPACTPRCPKPSMPRSRDALAEIRWLGQHSVTRVGPRDAREIDAYREHAGRRYPAQDLACWRPAPAHPHADRHPHLRRREVAGAGHCRTVQAAGRDRPSRHGGDPPRTPSSPTRWPSMDDP